MNEWSLKPTQMHINEHTEALVTSKTSLLYRLDNLGSLFLS